MVAIVKIQLQFNKLLIKILTKTETFFVFFFKIFNIHVLLFQVDHAAIDTLCACGNVNSDFAQSNSAVLSSSRR